MTAGLPPGKWGRVGGEMKSNDTYFFGILDPLFEREVSLHFTRGV